MSLFHIYIIFTRLSILGNKNILNVYLFVITVHNLKAKIKKGELRNK